MCTEGVRQGRGRQTQGRLGTPVWGAGHLYPSHPAQHRGREVGGTGPSFPNFEGPRGLNLPALRHFLPTRVAGRGQCPEPAWAWQLRVATWGGSAHCHEPPPRLCTLGHMS